MSPPSMSALNDLLCPFSSCESVCTLVPDDSDVDTTESGQGDKLVSPTSTKPDPTSATSKDESLDRAAASDIALDFLRSNNIPHPTTYAEATNLADRFPQHNLAILSLPIRHSRQSQPWATSKSFVKNIASHQKGNAEDRRPLNRRGPAHTPERPNWALAPDEPETRSSRSPSRGRTRRRERKHASPARTRNERRSKDERASPSSSPVFPAQMIKSLQKLAEQQNSEAAQNSARSTGRNRESPVQVRVRIPTDEILLSAPAFTKVASNSCALSRYPLYDAATPRQSEGHQLPPHLPASSIPHSPRTPSHQPHRQSGLSPVQSQQPSSMVGPAACDKSSSPFPRSSSTTTTLRRGPDLHDLMIPPAAPWRPLAMTPASEYDMRCELPELMRRMMVGDAGVGDVAAPRDGSSGWHSRGIVFGEGGVPRSPRGDGGFGLHSADSGHEQANSSSKWQGQDQKPSTGVGVNPSDCFGQAALLSSQGVPTGTAQDIFSRQRSTGEPPTPTRPSAASHLYSSSSASRQHSSRFSRSSPISTSFNPSVVPPPPAPTKAAVHFTNGNIAQPAYQKPPYPYTHAAKPSLDELINAMPHEELTHPALYEYVKAQIDAGLPDQALLKRDSPGEAEEVEAGEKAKLNTSSIPPGLSPPRGVFVQAKQDGWISFGHAKPVPLM
ncbi:hypothetical protein NEOLEDRAFT_1166791 [Neolentinus lepideus HHB14362 ss-1]|uniref:Uncharacterized protein n=1 Tax=Neolentinus lepideus HHB14362 ss-1 TaxID=1314782 RepID=A0A165V6X7_9AGAM|nr:hypothetical protein NEOLEDRAFT_1166791 [Neolentinus lepideus HHB14362 ss-1]